MHIGDGGGHTPEVGGELYVQYLGGAVLRDDIGEEEPEDGLQNVFKLDVAVSLFVDEAPDDGQQEGSATGDGEKTKITRLVTTSIAVGDKDIDDDGGEEEEKSFEK